MKENKNCMYIHVFACFCICTHFFLSSFLLFSFISKCVGKVCEDYCMKWLWKGSMILLLFNILFIWVFSLRFLFVFFLSLSFMCIKIHASFTYFIWKQPTDRNEPRSNRVKLVTKKNYFILSNSELFMYTLNDVTNEPKWWWSRI